MQGKKHRKFRGIIKQFELHFDFRPPYQILVDGNFLNAAHKIDIDITKKLGKIVKARVDLVTTKCIRDELKKLGMVCSSAFNHTLKMRMLRCAHDFICEPGMCIRSHIGKKNPSNLMVATQDQELQTEMSALGKVREIHTGTCV